MSILEKIKSHATIIIADDDFYRKLKQEIVESKLVCLNFDFDIEDKDTKSLKLENLEQIKSFLANKSSEIRYVITNRNMRLTQLQNAMLKMLEEASESTKVIFVVESVNYFLPTVLSRMQILEAGHFELATKKNIFSEYKKKLILAKDFPGLERLIKLEDLNNKNLISEKQLSEYLSLL